MEQEILSFLDAATNYLHQATVSDGGIAHIFNTPVFYTLLGGLLGCMPIMISYRYERKKREREKYLQELEKFYRPLLFQLEKTSYIYDLFMLEEKRQDSEVRTIKLLLENHEFSEPDMLLLDEIISSNRKSIELIEENSGIIAPDLKEDLLALVRHYELLEKLKNGQLQGRPDFGKYTYPNDIKNKVKKEIEILSKKAKVENRDTNKS